MSNLASPHSDPAGGSAALKSLTNARSALLESLEVPPVDGAPRFERSLSRLFDTYFQTRLLEIGAQTQKIALVAVGGYGRGELCPASDIDILIVCRRTIPAKAIDLAQPLFLPLWDAGYTLGHGFRTIGDCVKLAVKDNKVLASLLDARLVAGDASIFEELMQKMQERVIPRRSKAFLQQLDDEHARRLAGYEMGYDSGADSQGSAHGGGHNRTDGRANTRTNSYADAGDGSMLMEPNLKEGLGALREYHRLLWMARLNGATGDVSGVMRQAGFAEEDCALLDTCVDFLSDVRNRLHVLSGRKNDKLFIDLQPELAERMGFSASDELLAVEQFLGRLHRCMGDIKALAAAFRSGFGEYAQEARRQCEEIAQSGKGEIVVSHGIVHICPPEILGVKPELVLRAYVAAAQAQGEQCPVLEWQSRQAIARMVEESPQLLVDAGGFREALLTILGSGRAFDVLEQMVSVGLLAVYLPVFGLVRDRMQFDGFHTYPVGRHTLYVLACLEALNDGEGPYGRLWKGLKDPMPLMLGALFHDLGKAGADASGHSEKGALLAKEQLSAWGMPEQLVSDVVFLVRHHLLLARTAHRRDLSDESVVAQCAGIVGDTRRLDMLYLLTYADSRATGPKAWSQWAASLLHELCGKVRNMLRDNTLATPQSARTIMDTRDRVRSIVAGDITASDYLAGPQGKGTDTVTFVSGTAGSAVIAGTENTDGAEAASQQAGQSAKLQTTEHPCQIPAQQEVDNTGAGSASGISGGYASGSLAGVPSATTPDTLPEVRVSLEEAEQYLELVPSRYVLAMSAEEIVRHMGLRRDLAREIEDAGRRLSPERAAKGVVLLDPRPLHGRDGDVWELVVVAHNQTGLFSTVAGVLSLHGLNVFSADAFVWSDGTAVDIFRVSAPPDPLYAREFWGKVRGSIQYALIGKLSLEFRIDQMRSRYNEPEIARTDVEVVVDNDLSDFHTVIEVFAPDRPALLYDVVRTMQNMRLDILFAKIDTLGARTNDSFSVRDVYGQKLIEREQIQEVRNALLHVLRR